MSPSFCPHESYDDVTLDDMHPPFHLLMYAIDEESNSNIRLAPTYSMESDPLELSYPSVIHLTLDSSSSSTGPMPPLVHGRGVICIRVVPRRHGYARRGGCGDDALCGFENGYIPF